MAREKLALSKLALHVHVQCFTECLFFDSTVPFPSVKIKTEPKSPTWGQKSCSFNKTLAQPTTSTEQQQFSFDHSFFLGERVVIGGGHREANLPPATAAEQSGIFRQGDVTLFMASITWLDNEISNAPSSQRQFLELGEVCVTMQINIHSRNQNL